MKIKNYIDRIIKEEVTKVRLKEDAYSNEIAQKTGTRSDAVDRFLKANEIDSLTIIQGLGSGKINKQDFVQALLSDEGTKLFLKKYNSDGTWSKVWN